ncbi:MAG TPA: sugar ABC transporter ATP-binding protein [Gaiellaceae bacterium]|nr:sugar ABC transporter ATP-binding protein [Gaiellaceae bacterium]
MDAAEPRIVLEAERLEKRFGGIHALRGVDLRIASGRVHGLLGQNGSGKSTLLRILSGQIAPDGGRLLFAGVPTQLANPARALAAGVAIVSQELTLAPDLSVMENICLARRELRRRSHVPWRTIRRQAVEVLELLGLSVDPATPVELLRRDEQQLVEIGRAVSTDARILMLDEPTSSLTDDEVERLFSLLRTLRERGSAIVLVTQRLAEVSRVVDEVTVLRDGVVVAGSAALDGLDRRELVRLMTGASPSEQHEPHVAGTPAAGAPVLRLRGLTAPRRFEDVELAVHPGETVGLAGLTGSGRSELLASLFGGARSSGTIELAGKAYVPRTPAHAIAAGIAYVPNDRGRAGLVPDLSVGENIMLARASRGSRLRRPPRRRERAVAADALARFRIVPREPSLRVSALSGGNQQKVLLAKWLTTRPRLLLLDEPTRGVDVGAKADIHALLREQARDERVGILVSSSEADELRALCDRVLVMHRGRVVAELPGDRFTEASLLHHASR